MFDDWIGKTVHDTLGRPYRLGKVLGHGGQGVVFEESEGSHVVKVITSTRDRHELVRRYSWLITREFPKEANLVLPEALLAGDTTGYVMRRVKGHQRLTKLIHPVHASDTSLGEWYNNQTGGLRRRLLLSWQIARSFRLIHLRGLSYCDLSCDNILVSKDPRVISTCLIDLDNLSTPEAAEALVRGTPRYMAPEVLGGTHQPDPVTDAYSLAVVIHELLRLGHPFLGDGVNDGPPEMEEAALRGELPYIDHPEDKRNRCSTILPEKVVFPPRLSALFRQAFIDGVHDRWQRPTPGDFEDKCLNAALHLLACADCGASFLPPANVKPGEDVRCPWCGYLCSMPPFIEFYDGFYDETGNLNHGVAVQTLIPSSGGTQVPLSYVNPTVESISNGMDSVAFTLKWDSAIPAVYLSDCRIPFLGICKPGGIGFRTAVTRDPLPLPGETGLLFGDPSTDKCVRLGRVIVSPN